ncbi:MAG: YitT family protein [Mycoplasma sp.]|nr:YitT family protein [Mycoplasma sp.]
MNYKNFNKEPILKQIQKIILIILGSFLYSVGIHLFSHSAKSFASGLSAIPQLLTYLFIDLKEYYSILYLIFNIPFIIFFFFKTKKKFVVLTTIFLLFQTLWGSLLNYLIPDPDPFNVGVWTKEELIKKHFSLIKVGLVKEKWAIIIQTAIAGILVGFASVICWKNGSSTAGADFIVYYISIKKKKSLGIINSLVTSSISLSMILIQVILKKVPTGGNFIQQIFGPITFGTLSYIFLSSLVLGKFYPKYRKISIKITTKKPDALLKWMNESGYSHGYQINEVTSGYTNQKTWRIETVMLFLESKDFMKKIKHIDPNLFATRVIIKDIYGNFNTNIIDK